MKERKIIKVCGMRGGKNILDISQADIDWMGFIFYEKSPRFVPDQSVFAINAALGSKPEIKRVGVFVNATEEYILSKCLDFNLDIVQFHGDESPTLCDNLRIKGLTVVKAFQAGETDFSKYTPYEGSADYFLFDTKCDTRGGSGKSFDWNVLSEYKGNTPFILSGGINPNSIEALKTFNHPLWTGIDINSGFEISPAEKDAGKILEFVNKFRNI
jgi:phosphoribosylanthranilate isomerase